MTGPDSRDVLEELQSRLAFQEDTLEKLDAALGEQERRIARLSAALERLSARLDGALGDAPAPEHEPPPHY